VKSRLFAAGKELGSTIPGNIRNCGSWPQSVRGEESGFESRFPQDIAMAAGLGINAMRISFE
jgi:hypothetical protein